MDLKEKLQKVKEKLDNANINPDIDLEFYFFDDSSNPVENPYILVKYYPTESDVRETKIELSKSLLNEDVDNIVGFITFQIENFEAEIDSVEYGGE